MSPASVLGLPQKVSKAAFHGLLSQLSTLWDVQTGLPLGALEDDLEVLKRWFDPIATGERLRRALAEAPPRGDVTLTPPLIYVLPQDRVLITPEGRAALAVLQLLSSHLEELPGILLVGRPEIDDVEEILVRKYRSWLLQRLDGVTGLLDRETSTLRPAAAGLLLVLLVNRNTAPERALPRPRDRAKRAAVEDALKIPALAWSSAITGKSASAEAFDLYRGWAIGELARRLGDGLHLGFEDSGIFIADDNVDDALNRLVEDLQKRPVRIRSRIPDAWSLLLAAYREVRPRLAALGVLHERPSFTRSVGDRILAAAC